MTSFKQEYESLKKYISTLHDADKNKSSKTFYVICFCIAERKVNLNQLCSFIANLYFCVQIWLKTIKISINYKGVYILYISLSKHQSVSEWVCLCVCLDVPYLLRNGEPQRAEILRDDSPLDGEGLRLKNIRIRRTVSRKIACILAPHSNLAVIFILFNVNL